MKQPKKIFTKMCISNWGGISHKIIEFNEYVNLFSGMSGSGKSTVMDAIQVILYGSLSSNFLNKAADDAKNKRSVISYLRGEQKDGSANRDNQDFISIIALEIKDTGLNTSVCIGAWFEVHKNDTELRKYTYFSHEGTMPKDGYINEQGVTFTNKELKSFIEKRKQLKDSRIHGEVNKIYNSNEAYISNLYDVIFGYIDGGRFRTMQKSAIALKMTNGTGQFIRDYMFPKSEGDVIEKLSEQLGAYADIKEKIDDIKDRIDLLTIIKDKGIKHVDILAQLELTKNKLKCVDIMDARGRIEAWQQEKLDIIKELESLNKKKEDLDIQHSSVSKELVEVRADIKSSNLGSKRQHLCDLQEKISLLEENNIQWNKIIDSISKWSEDEAAREFVSDSVIDGVNKFIKGKIDEKICEELKKDIVAEREELEELARDYERRKDDVLVKMNDKKSLIEDLNNNRKSYSEHIRQAKSMLEQKLNNLYGKKIKVNVFADMFDVVDDEWKNAIEGRMGKLKLSLITEPEYADNAAISFKSFKQFEDVTLINSAAICKLDNKVLENSLYEAVSAKEKYIDECLKHYIGRIVKCKSVDELTTVRDGVTADCYSYSSFIFRHLKKREYTQGACIGSKVSKSKLHEYEQELEVLEGRFAKISYECKGIRKILGFESLVNFDTSYLVKLSNASRELGTVEKEKQKLEIEIESLAQGEYKQLQEKMSKIEEQYNVLKEAISSTELEIRDKDRQLTRVITNIEDKKEQLASFEMGYVANSQNEEDIASQLQNMSGSSLKNKLLSQRSLLESEEENVSQELNASRNNYIQKYPACGFNGAERSNDVYIEKLNDYQRNYEPKYQKEFDMQCSKVYTTLRENILAKIHNDIKSAVRQKNEINRMLRDTSFADSTYQIKIEAAKTQEGQFFEMLTSPELDTKNVSIYDIEGQLSFGDDTFYQKYEQKINLLMTKFIPPKSEDEKSIELSRKEMEKYADYRTYLNFNMYEQVTDDDGNIIRENYVDDMAGRDSGGEGQNPKYVALLAGFAMLYMDQTNRDSKIKLVLLDEAFSKMDQKRSEVCLKYARKLDLQLIVCVPDERLASLIRNVDCVYGFRRIKNNISMMHIDKGEYFDMLTGSDG